MDQIAIIGIGCRFPNAGNPESFWHLLHNGVHTITEIPSNRWDVEALYHPEPTTPGKMNTRWGSFLEQVDMFEPSFFGISSRVSCTAPPHQGYRLASTPERSGVPAATGSTAARVSGSPMAPVAG